MLMFGDMLSMQKGEGLEGLQNRSAHDEMRERCLCVFCVVLSF